MKTIPELYQQYIGLCDCRDNASMRINVAKLALADAVLDEASPLELFKYQHDVETARQDYDYYADEAAIAKEKLVQAALRL